MSNECEAPSPYRWGFPEMNNDFYIVPLYPVLTDGACGAPASQSLNVHYFSNLIFEL